MRRSLTLMTTKGGNVMKIAKKLSKVLLLCLCGFTALIAVYWWNLDNKFIFYVVRPLMNKLYDGQKRDVKL